jgi:prepilin-type N-terminal cleavage/methylation domain-containing protein
MKRSRSTLLIGVNTRRHSRPDAGFTMVELLITLVLVGIVLSMAVPAISGYLANTNLKSAARSLQGDIAYLRESAMTESSDGTKYCIQFDAGANKVYLKYDPGGAGTLLPLVNYPATRNLSDSGSGVYISNTSYAAPVKVYQRGFIGTPGTVEITNNRGSKATLTLLTTGKVYVTYSMQ